MSQQYKFDDAVWVNGGRYKGVVIGPSKRKNQFVVTCFFDDDHVATVHRTANLLTPRVRDTDRPTTWRLPEPGDVVVLRDHPGFRLYDDWIDREATIDHVALGSDRPIAVCFIAGERQTTLNVCFGNVKLVRLRDAPAAPEPAPASTPKPDEFAVGRRVKVINPMDPRFGTKGTLRDKYEFWWNITLDHDCRTDLLDRYRPTELELLPLADPIEQAVSSMASTPVAQPSVADDEPEPDDEEELTPQEVIWGIARDHLWNTSIVAYASGLIAELNNANERDD